MDYKIAQILAWWLVASLALFSVSAFGQSRVVAQVDVRSENSILVQLVWSGTNQGPIHLTGWDIQKEGMVIYYRTGNHIPEGFHARTIEDALGQFPTKIRLVNQDTDHKSFSDLEANHRAYEAVMNLYDQNIIDGYLDGSFKPDDPVTRSEFSKLLTLTAGYEPEPGLVSHYPDLNNEHWSTAYVMPLTKRGILAGNPDGTFRPNGHITIGEVLKVLDMTFGFFEDEKAYPYQLDSHWSNPNFLSLTQSGFINRLDGFYQPYTPNDKASRALCAILLSRVLETMHEVKP